MAEGQGAAYVIPQPEKVYAPGQEPKPETPDVEVEVDEVEPKQIVSTELKSGAQAVAPHPKSGMAMQMAQYLKSETDEAVVEEEEKPDETVKPDVKDEKPTEETEDYKDYTPEQYVQKITEVNELASSREEEISQLKEQVKAGGNTDLATDMKSLQDDFVGNYSKVREKYKLPALDTLKDMLSEGDPSIILKKWQDTELTKSIEKKHELLDGEFEYDPSEASQVGTPSYDWDEMTKGKRDEVFGSSKARQQKALVNSQKVIDQQAKDMDWLAENVWDSKEVVTTKLQGMQDKITKIGTGEVDSSEHPMGLRTILKGAYHEELVEKAVEEAITNLTAEYAKNKMFLPGGEMPTDASTVSSGGEVKKKGAIFTKEQRSFSPMLNSMDSFLENEKN